jgi:HK97 family phage portal protein
VNLFGLNISWGQKAEAISLDTLMKRLDAVYETYSGIAVTQENCEEAPTVKAIIRAVTGRFAVMPVHVYQKKRIKNRDSKEFLPSHPVERLLGKPNDWQARTSYWQDAISRRLRYGNFYAFKARGITGPIRRLEPLHPSACEPEQDDDLRVTYRVTRSRGTQQILDAVDVHHVRGPSRNGLKGDSPVMDVRETIALEIAAEKFGAAFFGNGALPGFVFEYMEGSQGFKTDEERKDFLDEFQDRYTKKGRFRAILPPKGIKMGTPIAVENDKAQFLQLRQHQRTVIAGAWGCPPHLVGDLSKGTFNNVEAQGGEFTTNLILPIAREFEAAMEKDLLTDEDRRSGVVIRFNPDAVLRGDFKQRQEGLAIQRQNGVINANEWREREDMNPRDDEGGEQYYAQGPSGQQPASNNADPVMTDPNADPAQDSNNAD